MVCKRFQSDGMRLLDGEMSESEESLYEAHLQECADCRKELEEIGMVVRWTNKLKLKKPDDEFWDSYWDGLYRRMERGIGFLLVVVGVIALLLFLIIKAITSPQLLTFTGISLTLVLAGLLIVFISVARERYHESKDDPYRKVKR